jgi:hypothetical protein
MQKTMILPACLGILLVGIVMIPGVFAAGGCGEGTVLVDGVCQLAPVESSGCGQGTVLVDGVCVLDKTAPVQGSAFSFDILHVIVIIGVVIAGGVIALIFVVRRGSSGTKTPKPARQDLHDYESQYLQRQGQRPSPKPAETRPTSSACNNCGARLKPTAKFCGGCGTQRS